MYRPLPLLFALLALLTLSSSVRAQDGNSQQWKTWLSNQDSNGDGRIARDEASGLMKRFFDRNDVNKDGSYQRYTNNSGHSVFGRNAKETVPMMEAFFARTLKSDQR